MFRETSHSTTEAIIELIRTLPVREQALIARSLAVAKPKKKLSRKEKKKQEVLNDIREGLREIKEAKRTGKELPDFQELLHELKHKNQVH